MSGAICAIFIFSSPPGPAPSATYCVAKSSLPPRAAKSKIRREIHPVQKFIILYENSSFSVGDRRQKGDLGAPRIEPRVLDDDWHVRLEYRSIVGITRDRFRVVEIIEAQVQCAPGGDGDAVGTDRL